jgi:L-2,4-diaminobutyrate decarboxylase
MTTGVRDPGRHVVLVPQGIGHYSISSSLAWIGCGAQAVPVPTANFRYDLDALADALAEHAGRVMAVVAYAGDSRTQTLEDLRAVHDLVRGTGESIWLHVDACWGLMAALTPRLAHRLDGITEFDSVTVDPHKVLDVPYSVSALLVRDPAALRSVSSFSDLIMQEDFALGQVTPFLGTRGWTSLSLWSLLRAHGRRGLADIVEDRLDRTAEFVGLVDAHPRLLRLNEPDMTAVTFMVLPVGFDRANPDIDGLNRLNIAIHDHIIDAGRWHLHQFSLPDPGHFQAGALLHPLRFNGINRRITSAHLHGVLDYLLGLADAIEHTPAGAR